MRVTITFIFSAVLLLCGCASNQKHAQKPILERPWIGGSFERVSTSATVRTNAQHFAGHGMLVTRVREESPLAKAGVAEGDILLRLNDTNVRCERDLQMVVDRVGAATISIDLYRNGEIIEKAVAPGVERYQKIHHVIFGLGISTAFEVDVFPNPDFSLVALGFDSKGKRLDLRDADAKYRIAQGEYYRDDKNGWQGLTSAEGWKAWLGPFAVSENKLIISQEPAQ